MLPQETCDRIRQRIREIYSGKTQRELAQILSEEFETTVTMPMLAYYMRTMGIQFRELHRIPPEVKAFIVENVKGRGPVTMRKFLAEKLGYDVTINTLKSFYRRKHLHSELTGHFEKGHASWNKGKKGWTAPGTEKTHFQKGHMPKNHREVGSERVDPDGYTYVKIAEPNKWALKHRLIYEQHYGKLPKGQAVIFKDQNRQNFAPENLMPVTRAELSVLNRHMKLCEFPEVNKTKVLITKLMLKGERANGRKLDNPE